METRENPQAQWPRRWRVALVATGLSMVAGLWPTLPAVAADSEAQQTDNGRCLIYSIWTWNDSAEALAQFQAEATLAAQVGFNVIKIHVGWSLCEQRPGEYDFSSLDARLDHVWGELGLPVAIGIDLTRRPPREGPDAVAGPEHWQRDRDGELAMIWTGRPMIAFASAPAVDRAAAFVAAVTRHCEARRGEHVALFYEPAFSPYVETEYFPDKIYDYSDPARERFRTWLAARHGDIAALNRSWETDHADFSAIEPPDHFDGPMGLDWYCFRHAMLKGAIDRMVGAIRDAAPTARVSLRFGSVFDAAMHNRATVWFPDLCADADIVFVDDAPQYDHRWSMDLLRGSLPGKDIGNEVDHPNLADDETYAALIGQSFSHGARFATVANWHLHTLEQRRGLFEAMAARWLGQPVARPPDGTPTLTVDGTEVFVSDYNEARRRHGEILSQGAPMVHVVLTPPEHLAAPSEAADRQ